MHVEKPTIDWAERIVAARSIRMSRAPSPSSFRKLDFQ
jgi:hypothetical protein